jgi:hypothetical protein
MGCAPASASVDAHSLLQGNYFCSSLAIILSLLSYCRSLCVEMRGKELVVFFKALAFRGIKNISVGKEALVCLNARTNTHHHTYT